MNYQVSLCYHPTRVVFVDDNLDFIRIIQLVLKNIFHCKFYNDPLKALIFFKEQYRTNSFNQRCFVEPANEQADHLFYNIDLRRIHKEINVLERFEEIAVAVIDYTMPGMNGLELSQQIRALHPDIRILLLTGEADYDTAVQLFNAGIIDKFIKKDTPDIINALIQAIEELKHKYFISLSKAIFDKLNGSSDKLNRLTDPAFTTFFSKLCQQYDIVEYYLIDNMGSFLLFNREGKPHWLALMSNQELDEFYEYAKTEKAPKSVVEPLKAKTKLPFFYTDNDLRMPPSNWQNYLHPAEKIEGLTTYYYSLINDTTLYEWCPSEATLYKDYLKESTN